jgi:hypothetical protein
MPNRGDLGYDAGATQSAADNSGWRLSGDRDLTGLQGADADNFLHNSRKIDVTPTMLIQNLKDYHCGLPANNSNASRCSALRRHFREARTLTDGAGGFLPGMPASLGCLGMALLSASNRDALLKPSLPRSVRAVRSSCLRCLRSLGLGAAGNSIKDGQLRLLNRGNSIINGDPRLPFQPLSVMLCLSRI